MAGKEASHTHTEESKGDTRRAPVERVVEKYLKDGKSTGEIAAEEGVTQATISNRLKEAGVRTRWRSSSNDGE